jgi:dTDP-4-dehydrorhamnose reductase
MKILITGGEGYLARQLSSVLQDFQVFSPGKHLLDITDSESVKKYSEEFKPDLIIHTAAITDVNYCQTKPDQAYLVNTYGTINLVNYNPDSKIIFISTDYVFDGKRNHPYNEYDIPNPLSVYGRSKFAAENFIQTRSSQYIIIRTSWLFNSNNDFLTKIAPKIKQHQSIRIIGDQFGNPTMNWDLAEAIFKLLKSDYTGIINITNTGTTTWFDIAKFYIHRMGIENLDLINISIDDYQHEAPRPRYSALSSHLFNHILGYKLPQWELSLLKHKEFKID